MHDDESELTLALLLLCGTGGRDIKLHGSTDRKAYSGLQASSGSSSSKSAVLTTVKESCFEDMPDVLGPPGARPGERGGMNIVPVSAAWVAV